MVNTSAYIKKPELLRAFYSNGSSEAAFYVWKKRFGTLGTPEIRELRQLRDENGRLKQVVADLTLDRPSNARIKDIAAARVRYGQRRIYVLLRREGWHVNIKRVARIYRAEGLAIRTKMPRRRRAALVYRSKG